MNSEIKTILKLSTNFENEFTPETFYKLSFAFRDKVETNFLMKHELEIKTSA